MKSALIWLWDYWYIPLIVALSVAIWIVLRRGTPIDALNDELDVIKAGADARKLVAAQGAGEALNAVSTQHRDALDKLDDDQQIQAERLKDDPVALARFLVRAAK